ncbi:hypothetical protein C7416_104459 [Cupriavidus phytorum]|uniref:Uncharacterized protein n=1 Tax=Cupriavidus phytorum TaxID=3024399 RepID=A0A2W7P014_9BURK|nr:hypothetical protein [Cupriavidus alkaliphilus]PZX29454.1 hypothetical protein C7416_104459 [Cupriavidus alkaliphilus]
MSDERNCKTCGHSKGSLLGGEFRRCARTGYYCDTELKFGGRCQTLGGLALWEPKPPLHRRFIRIFTGVKA